MTHLDPLCVLVNHHGNPPEFNPISMTGSGQDGRVLIAWVLQGLNGNLISPYEQLNGECFSSSALCCDCTCRSLVRDAPMFAVLQMASSKSDQQSTKSLLVSAH